VKSGPLDIDDPVELLQTEISFLDENLPKGTAWRLGSLELDAFRKLFRRQQAFRYGDLTNQVGIAIDGGHMRSFLR
jgi:hypothetical protein